MVTVVVHIHFSAGCEFHEGATGGAAAASEHVKVQGGVWRSRV